MKTQKILIPKANRCFIIEPLAEYQVKSIKDSKPTYAQSKKVDPQLQKQSDERIKKMLQNIRESAD